MLSNNTNQTIDADFNSNMNCSMSPDSDDHSIDVDVSYKSEVSNKQIFHSTTHEILCIVVLCAAQLMTQAALLSSILPAYDIGRTFHTDAAGQLSWFAAAFSLTVGTFILPAGRIGDIYGYKRVLIVGYMIYSIGSILAGLSSYTVSIPFYDICRAIQGFGVAIAFPNALAILGRVYPAGKTKNYAFAAFAACAPNGAMIGGLVTSAFAEYVNWTWGYYVAGILSFLLSVACIKIIPTFNDEHRDTQSFDIHGACSGVTGLVLLNFSLNQGPTVGWDTPYVYACCIVGVVMLAVFVYVEQCIAVQPLIPFADLHFDTISILACVSLGWAGFGVWLWYTVQFLESIRGSSAMHTLVEFVPVCITGTTAALIAGYLLHHIHAINLMILSLCAFTTGLILLATAPVQQIYWAQTFVGIAVQPFGMDVNFASATIFLSNSVSDANQGIAASLVSTVVNYSISIGLGIAGTVQSYVDQAHPTDPLQGIHAAYYTGIGFTGTGLLLAILLRLVMAIKKQNK